MLRICLLGPVEAHRDGQPIDLGGPQPRAVVAHLALDAGRVVSVERLIDRLWGDDPPRTPLGTLQSYVSRLRRALEPGRRAGDASQVLASEAPGYVLRIAPEQVDVHCFRRVVEAAREATAAGDHAGALRRYDEALALWRGPALAGAGSEDQLRAVVTRLDEEHAAAGEDRFETLLALGRHTDAVPLLQAAIDEQPLRERRRGLLALALYRSGRQADALRSLATARASLLDELGLDPGPELRELERRILAQDPALLVRSRAATAPTVEIVSPVVSAAPVPAVDAELVGRGAEWARLTGALDAARRGRAQLALVEGEPGIGKSTLCEAFLDQVADAGWRTATGRCVEPGLAPSLWPCIEIVRTIAGATDDGAAGNPLRQMATGQDSAGSLSPVEMADHFVALLDAVDAERWVFVLDDLHWADGPTLDVTALVLERLARRPVLVVGALRPPETVDGSLLGGALGALQRSVPVTRIPVSPLDAEAVASVMEAATGAPPSHEIAERVRRRAGGNPLFVAELARLAGERGLADDAVVPAAIRDVVRSRLARLPERARAELEVVAVLGERFDLRTVMAASERPPDDCLDALDAAIVTRILVPAEEGLRFAHALVRDTVLADVPPLRRARLHRRAADAILTTLGDGPDQAEPIAHHRLAAVSVSDPAVVAKAAVRAADVARWRGALGANDALAEQALAVLAGAPRTATVRAVEVEALEALVSSAMRSLDPARLGEVTARVGIVAEATGNENAEALHLFLTWGPVDETADLGEIAPAVERVRPFAERVTDSYAIVMSHFLVGAYGFLVGDVDEAADYIDRAIAAAGAGVDERPEHVPLVQLPNLAGVVAAVRGHADTALEHAYRRAPAWLSQRTEVEATADVSLLFLQMLVRAVLDDPAAVAAEVPRVFGERHHRAFESGSGVLDQYAASGCEALLGWALARRGDTDGVRRARAALARLDAGEERTLRCALRAFAADGALAVGDDEAAAELIGAARAEAELRGERWWLAEIARLQAVVAQRTGDTAMAEALVDEAAALAESHGSSMLLAPRLAATRAALDG